MSEVYRRKVNTWDEMPDFIMDAIDLNKERQDELRRATRHVLTRVAKCIDVDGGIFENVMIIGVPAEIRKGHIPFSTEILSSNIYIQTVNKRNISSEFKFYTV
jgi:hypothetical protein